MAALMGCDRSTESSCRRSEVATEAGLRYRDLRCGDGSVAERGDAVTVSYSAELADGTPLRSPTRGGTYTFALGEGQAIAGLDQGIPGMRVGGRRRLVVPPDLALGDGGRTRGVPPGATIAFEVELLAVEDPPP